jgi:hypothetical protein
MQKDLYRLLLNTKGTDMTTRGNNNGYRARPDLRLALKLRDGFRCLYCNKDLADGTFDDVTIDHLVPVVNGGSNDTINVITACRSCNCSRQDRPWKGFAKEKGGEKAVRRILRNTRREIKKYRAHAKALIEDGYSQQDTHSREFVEAIAA